MRALLLALFALFSFAPVTDAYAQQAHTESAASQHGVPVRANRTPGGIDAWLV